jgi:hypothetical protein
MLCLLRALPSGYDREKKRVVRTFDIIQDSEGFIYRVDRTRKKFTLSLLRMPLRDSEIQNMHLWTLKLTKMDHKIKIRTTSIMC